MTLREAAQSRTRSVELEPEFCIGMAAGEFIYGFPPGIPLLKAGRSYH